MKNGGGQEIISSWDLNIHGETTIQRSKERKDKGNSPNAPRN